MFVIVPGGPFSLLWLFRKIKNKKEDEFLSKKRDIVPNYLKDSVYLIIKLK